MARRTLTIRDRDRGYKQLRERARGLRAKHAVGVGITGTTGAQIASGELTVLDIGTIHEFGLGRVPQRSFVRAWFDELAPKNKRRVMLIAQRVLKGQLSERRGLELLGLEFQASMQARITRGIAPPNAPATIAKKGSSTSLIDTGQLRQAISYEVEL
jgi:hypothetical protein